MPCDSVSVIGVAVGKMDAAILKAGLTADGHQVAHLYGNPKILVWTANRVSYQYNAETGQLEQSTSYGRRNLNADAAASEIKQSFSRQLVRNQAKRYGWQLKQTGNKFTVIKRTV